jgi:hypothetical protein
MATLGMIRNSKLPHCNCFITELLRRNRRKLLCVILLTCSKRDSTWGPRASIDFLTSSRLFIIKTSRLLSCFCLYMWSACLHYSAYCSHIVCDCVAGSDKDLSCPKRFKEGSIVSLNSLSSTRFKSNRKPSLKPSEINFLSIWISWTKINWEID